MTRALLRLAAIAAALMLLLTACGSDDDSAGTDGDTGTDTAQEGTTVDPATDDGEMTDEMADDMADGGHEHGDTTDVSDLDPPPSLELEVLVDDKGGFNVHAVPTNHEVSAEAASTEHVPGQGHLHLYVDGERVARFYNEWIHVGDLEPGDHDFRVELSANDHSALAIDGTVIDQTVTVTQPERESHSHSPEPTEIDVDTAPSLEVTVTEDPKSGFNLQAVPTGFTLTPENVNGDNVDGEGHMHIYVDGEKLTRLYGEWFHIKDEFGTGEHEVRVELSNNDHSAVAVDGTIVEAVTTFTSTSEMESHGDDDGDGHDEGGHDDMADDMADEMAVGDADHVVEITYAEGAVVGGPATVETATGESVLLVITSDIDEEVHVHGADVYGEVSAGDTTEIAFVAEIPGQFEIELEERGQLLATLVTT